MTDTSSQIIDVENLEKASECCGKCGCAKVAGLKAKIDPLVENFIFRSNLVKNFLLHQQRPIHVLFPQIAVANWQNFKEVLKTNAIDGRVLYTSKANKSASILSALAIKGADVDVSSEGALKHALNSGVAGTKIQASGPKTADYLMLCLIHRTRISINSLDELELLVKLLHTDSYQKARILIRISDFKSEYYKFTANYSPFGIAVNNLTKALMILKSNEHLIDLLGFHFHLFTSNQMEKVIAFENVIEAVNLASKFDFNPKIINIGGGFPVQYADNSQEWQNFQAYLKDAVLGNVQSITWESAGLGFRNEAGRISGAPAYSDLYPLEPGAIALDSFLKMPCPNFDNLTVADLLRDLMLELHVEPGRAILAQAGITICKVISTSKLASGQQVANLNINNTNLRSKEQKLLTQPIFLNTNNRKAYAKSYFLFGNLCTSIDLLQANKTYPGFKLKLDDLVIFINTAAYNMDFSESETLHQKLPQKHFAIKSSNEFVLMPEEDVSIYNLQNLLSV